MVKTLKAVVGAIIAVLIIILVYSIVSPLYDDEETMVAVGQTYDLSEGWIVEFEDGRKISDVSLPYTIPADKADSVMLSHNMSEEYQGLALNFLAENSALRIFMEGKPIFESGYTDNSGAPNLGNIRDRENMGEAGMMPDLQGGGPEPLNGMPNGGPEGGNEIPNEGSWPVNEGTVSDEEMRNAPNFEQPLMNDTTSTRVEAGEITADLPSTISDSIMRIQLNKVTDSDIIVKYATVCKRDVAVINVLRDSMFPILCGLLVLFACVVLLMLDAVRQISGERMRGLAVAALMGFLAVIFMILQTDLMKMFFSNKTFFNKMAIMVITLIPLLTAWFYKLGFSINFPKNTRIMLGVTLVGTLLILGTELSMLDIGKAMIKPLTSLLYFFVVVNILIILIKWNKKGKGYHIVRYDLISVACFSVAFSLVQQGNIHEHSQVTEYIIDIFITLTMYFIMAQHISIVIANYKEKVEKNSKELERQVEIADLARRDAIAANEAKGKFLANMSHEIRTPINAVLGMDEMILRESREKSIREYAMDIHTAGQSLLSIINDILDMSKIESGKMEIIPVDYDTSSMIHDLSNMISLRAKAKSLKFLVNVDENIPARLHGDDVRVKQVLTNILTNAVKYTQAGTVWFRVSGSRQGENELLHFEVEDTGIGIKQEDMSKLFEAFQRIEEDRNRNIEGTGLGMNITLQMLNMMGSKLEVESEYGKGSKFYFDLIQGVVDDTPLGDFEERIKKLEEQYVYDRAFIAPDAKVLVVDDNPMNRKVFSALLKPTQILVEEAEGGAEAIKKVQEEYFDIIFMDHMMPEMDGLEAMHHIKELEDSPCKGVPILVLTANAVAGAREEYLKEGFDGFLSKPVVSDKLEKAICEFLPKEKVLKAPEDMEEERAEEAVKTDIDDLPMVDGLDWNIALLHLSTMELIESSCKEFYKLIEIHGDKLQKQYEGLPSSLDDYRILVHGMKSSAASIGIIPLAGMAKVLEFAAKDKDLERIYKMHDIFLKEWFSYKDKLKGVFALGEEEKVEKESLDKEALKVLLKLLNEAMEDLDIDGADEAMSKLAKVELPEDMSGEIPVLQGMVADLDSDGVEEITGQWLERL
ncbi:MAG: response regulator [Lachnospiraceae bacterium]|nr:response regulator [Lachnospiraceae bacterium]